jgi:hypothetical protein
LSQFKWIHQLSVDHRSSVLDALKNRLQNGPDLRVRSSLPPSTNHWITRASILVSDVFYVFCWKFHWPGNGSFQQTETERKHSRGSSFSFFSGNKNVARVIYPLKCRNPIGGALAIDAINSALFFAYYFLLPLAFYVALPFALSLRLT